MGLVDLEEGETWGDGSPSKCKHWEIHPYIRIEVGEEKVRFFTNRKMKKRV